MSATLAVLLVAGSAALGTVPWRGRSPSRVVGARTEAEPEVPGLADLLGAAVGAGTSVPGALVAVGRAAGGDRGRALARAGAMLGRGAPWSAAWAGAPAELDALERALAAAWHVGAAPLPVLRLVAVQVRRDVRQRAGVAAARLGVRLVLPLGLCLLPSFVLLGIVPLVLSLGGQLLGP